MNLLGKWRMHHSVMLVVVVFYICAFLFPNSLLKGRGRGQARSLVSRTKADMRSLATALEEYHTDHSVYPAMHSMRDYVKGGSPEAFRKIGGANLSTVETGGQHFGGLTTPLSYITSLFLDISAVPEKQFYEKSRYLPFAYYTNGKGWIVFSPGPDKHYDITNPARLYDWTGEESDQARVRAALAPFTYDPTNGNNSKGDIWRIHD